ncbi:hypothetical protein K1719_019373 [Acacia pycnantha]|nr:hypothetical protein K1719_019373 [Acacia pycnantha]
MLTESTCKASKKQFSSVKRLSSSWVGPVTELGRGVQSLRLVLALVQKESSSNSTSLNHVFAPQEGLDQVKDDWFS